MDSVLTKSIILSLVMELMVHMLVGTKTLVQSTENQSNFQQLLFQEIKMKKEQYLPMQLVTIGLEELRG